MKAETKYSIKLDGKQVMKATIDKVFDPQVGRALCNLVSLQHKARRSRVDFTATQNGQKVGTPT